jgi:AcrR family transcriptional regulator
MAGERGRPRDPGVDKAIMNAALEEFAARGWSGFTIDRVARIAGVGKGSVYLRWNNKVELLTAALEEELRFVPENTNSGSYAGDLRALARQFVSAYSGVHGRAFLRVLMELTTHPDFKKYSSFRREQLATGRAMIRRAKERGEIPQSVPVTLPLDALSGAILMHIVASPRQPSARSLELLIENVVSLVLAATTDASIDWLPTDETVYTARSA